MADHEAGDVFAEGRTYPATVDDIGPWRVTLNWQVIDGRVECARINIEPTQPGAAIPDGIGRLVPLGDLIRRNRARITADAVAQSTTQVTGLRRSTRVKLEEAARVYREAFAAGRPPSKAVAAHFGLTQGGASSLVARARAAGLLPPTSPGAPQA